MAATAITETAEQQHSLHRRTPDDYTIFKRKRNAHACMMSIVFIVLFPLGAISLHLPLKGHRVVPFIHAPIQLLGLAMMIGAMGLGIDIAKNDLFYFSPVKSHIIIGLLTASMIILLQPALGFLQHHRFKRTGQRSIYSHIHRWNGRIFIVLGWINSGLGFQLTSSMEVIAAHSYIRNFVLMGVLGGLWIGLVAVDGLRTHWLQKDKLAAHSFGEKKVFANIKPSDNSDPLPAGQEKG